MAEPAAAALPDFWLSSGFHRLERDAAGHLAVTDDLLRAYLERPELHPVGEAETSERALHDTLQATPRANVTSGELAAIADADTRDKPAWSLRSGLESLPASYRGASILAPAIPIRLRACASSTRANGRGRQRRRRY